MLYGLERIAHPEDGAMPTVALLAAGTLVGWLAVRHLARAKNPLLDLSAFKVQTFAISTLSAGTHFPGRINATPFLLPLLFQVGFGLRPVDAGMLILAYFLGNLGIKTPTLRRFGSVRCGVIASLSIMACAAISPQTPQALVVALMLIAGLTRSMQVTALNTLAFADVASFAAQLGGDTVQHAAARGDAVRRGGRRGASKPVADREKRSGARPGRLPPCLPGDRRNRARGLIPLPGFVAAVGAEVSGHLPRN